MKVTVDRREGIAVIYTDGYINSQGGEEMGRSRELESRGPGPMEQGSLATWRKRASRLWR